ncbi:MAG: hypothetical protein ABS81_07495 [Pseudonocardia sp. SCN 72-86]|nr:MAG: hypothetical protein ABS81_07495 [Pseudonocardia sp. SCN 72-86]
MYELEEEEEEGAVPTRRALQARLRVTRSAICQQVVRLERDGLVELSAADRIRLTEPGRAAAVRIIRKHRLVERLLVDIIGLDWELSHAEATRWQHVVSDAVERKLVMILDAPEVSPFGNPIPGLDQLTSGPLGRPDDLRGTRPLIRLDDFARRGGGRASIAQLFERIQADRVQLSRLRRAGVVPGGIVDVRPEGLDRVDIAARLETVVLDAAGARSVIVAPYDPQVAGHEVDRTG